MTHHVRIFMTLAALLCLGTVRAAEPAPADAATLDRDFSHATLQIAGDTQLHTFRVWVADTDARRARGLMFVQRMDANAGMLFIYPHAQRIAMWMKNTVLPLDMLFVDAGGRVINVAANATPQSLDTIESGGAALGVIELNAGTAQALGIRAGAQVIHPAFLPR